MEKARAHLVIHGRVQGVFFRYNTRARAEELGLKGWVRNNLNGTVEAVFEGSKKDVERIVAWCGRGPPGARVDKVDTEWEEPRAGFDCFEVRGW